MSDFQPTNTNTQGNRTKALAEIAAKIQETSTKIINSHETAEARATELKKKKWYQNAWGTLTGKNKRLRDDMNTHVIQGQRSINDLSELINQNVALTSQLFDDFGQEVFGLIEDLRAKHEATAEEIGTFVTGLTSIVKNTQEVVSTHDEAISRLSTELDSIKTLLDAQKKKGSGFATFLALVAIAGCVYLYIVK